MFKDTKEGTTHYQNDGCGEPAHNNPILKAHLEGVEATTVYRYSISKSEYADIHYWLRKNYGKATRCESKQCNGKTHKFEWALKRNKKYQKKRSYFKQLCRSCHRKYDLTKEGRKRISQAMKAHRISSEQRKRMIQPIMRPVLQFDLQGKFLKEYISVSEAGRQNNIKMHGISAVLTGTNGNKTAGGYIWRYKVKSGLHTFKDGQKIHSAIDEGIEGIKKGNV